MNQEFKVQLAEKLLVSKVINRNISNKYLSDLPHVTQQAVGLDMDRDR